MIDQSSSSPTVAPDGSVFYGPYSRYNYARGHMFKFSSTGAFLAAYFGWDTTPAILSHADGVVSVVEKDNHYNAGSYCNDKGFCPVAPPGPYGRGDRACVKGAVSAPASSVPPPVREAGPHSRPGDREPQ